MAKVKQLDYALLLDIYGELLTEKQHEALGLSYEDDLSLSEIASEMGITRQAAADLIRHGEEKLRELEEKLHVMRGFTVTMDAVGRIRGISRDPEVLGQADRIEAAWEE